MLGNLRVKVRALIRKYKRWIFIILIAWAVVFVINYFLKNIDRKKTPSTTYKPFTPIMGGSAVRSTKKQNEITTLIDEYVKFLNDKEYEKAYELLSKQCKENMFTSLEEFTEYVRRIFSGKKTYTIQNYYNEKDIYVYRLRIFDDILATGIANENGLEYLTEIVTITEEDGFAVLSVGGYIGKENIGAVYEDQNIRVEIVSRQVMYETETYQMIVTNKSQYYVSILDDTPNSDLFLSLTNGNRTLNNFNGIIAILPKQKKTYNLTFTRYFHETEKASEINIPSVKILRDYPAKYNENSEIIDMVSEYGIKLNVKK